MEEKELIGMSRKLQSVSKVNRKVLSENVCRLQVVIVLFIQNWLIWLWANPFSEHGRDQSQ